MSEQKTIQYNDETLSIQKAKYSSKPNLISLQLYDAEGFPYMTATRNLDKDILANYPIDKDTSALIKNYAENEGILKVLIENKIVEDTGKIIRSGFESLNLVKVLI